MGRYTLRSRDKGQVGCMPLYCALWWFGCLLGLFRETIACSKNPHQTTGIFGHRRHERTQSDSIMAKRWITRGGIGQPGLGQTRQYVVSDGVTREGIMSLKQQREWLKRSRLWPMMQINNYVPKRVLGAGAHGIVGVWELNGRSQVLPKLIVVKQVRVDSDGEQLEVEAKLLRDLVATDTHHVVQLYKGYHEESGSGSSEQSDPLPFDANAQWDPTLLVARLYMEYCQYGSVESAMEKIFNDPDAVIPEDFIWRVLHCLASGLVVLKHGNESSNDNSPTWKKPMAHFDLKPANSTCLPLHWLEETVGR
jgi:hypothetical protein